MDFRDTLYCRIISSLVLFSFTWTFLGGADIAYAMKQDSPASSTPAREKSHAKKLTDTLSTIETVLEDTSLDIKGRKDKLAAYQEDLSELDAGMREDFKSTEKHIKDKRLPEAVLNRHKAFVERYEQNHAQLKKHIEVMFTDMSASDFETKRQEVLKYLEGVKPPKKHVPLDPSKLPHRAMEEKKARTEDWVAPKPFKLTPIKKKSMFERPELDSPYASLYEPFEGYSSSEEAPVLVASSGSLSGLLDGTSIASSTPASAEDLAETIDVKFTPAIMAKAAELANTPQAKSGALPIAIYEWVRNNVEYVPTWGSIQGADYCLQTMKCNSFDMASLMIALFRANGIHARYATVTGEMKVERFMNWMGGFTNATAAWDFAATGGMPVTGLVEGGQIKYVRFEQVVVEGWVDMFPSRGAKHKEGDYWIRFDPSFKEYAYAEGMNVANAVPFDGSAFIESASSSATYSEAESYISGIDASFVNTTVTDYQERTVAFINQTSPNPSIDESYGGRRIIKHEFPILMGTLPYRTKTVHARYREIPDSLRHKVQITVSSDGAPVLSEPVTVTLNLPEVAGKKLSLSYAPDTDTDDSIMKSYLGEESLPIYLVNVKAQVSINDAPIASGTAIPMGIDQQLTISFISPTSTNRVTHALRAGDYAAIGLNTGMLGIDIDEKIENVSVTTYDEIISETLYQSMLGYWMQNEMLSDAYARTFDVNAVRVPSEGLATAPIDVEYSFGIPISGSYRALAFDIKSDLMMVKARDGNSNMKVKYNIVAGMIGSVLEGAVFDQLFPEDTERGISAIKLLAVALQSGIKVYGIDKSNIDTVIPKLQVDTLVISDVRNAVNSGNVAIMPESTMSHAGWTGDGYIAIDSQGNGAYMLSSGEAGGRIAFSMAATLPPVTPPDLKGLQESFQSWLSEKGISYAKLINACPLELCGSSDTACNYNRPSTQQVQFKLSSILNFIFGFLVSDAEAVCLVDDLTFTALMGLSILVLILFKMGADIYTDSKARTPDYPDDDMCSSELTWCLENVWQPDWNVPKYGPRKNCSACYFRCTFEGAWPEEMCPREL